MPLPPQVQKRPYRVVANEPLADGVFKLILEAEDSANAIPLFQAGQWVNMGLLNPDGSEWAHAAYSLVNAPCEGVTRLELGIKVTGDFTKRSHDLKVGDVVSIQGPWGLFTLKPDMTRTVMFAGGIGVTPFISMIREASAAKLPIDLVLFYSNKTCAETAYREELRTHASTNPRVRIVDVCTRESHTNDGIKEQRIDASLLDATLEDVTVGEYLLCGPRSFMDDLTAMLLAKGIDPKRIRRELFS